MTWRDPGEAVYEVWRAQMLAQGYAPHRYDPSQAWGGPRAKACIVEEVVEMGGLGAVRKPCIYEVANHDPRLPTDGWAGLTATQRSAFIDLADAAIEAAMGAAAVG